MSSGPQQAASPRIAAVAFDLDGTLVDSFADLTFAVNLTRARYGLPDLAQAEVCLHVGAGTEELVRKTVPVRDTERALAYQEFLRGYDLYLLRTTRPYPGVEAALDGLASYPLAVITNKPIAQAQAILTGLGWAGRFALVLGGDSLAEKKPSPQPVLEFARRSGVDPGETLMVGDSLADVRSARGAGAACAAVTYGNTARELLAAEHPDYLIDRLDELIRILR